MKTKNLYLYITCAVLLIFSIGYFITVNNVSYAFSYDNLKLVKENQLKLIEKSAALYGNNNKKLFQKDKDIYITVGDLVKEKYFPADEDDKVYEAGSDKKVINSLKIRLSLKKDKVIVKILN